VALCVFDVECEIGNIIMADAAGAGEATGRIQDNGYMAGLGNNLVQVFAT
jgi:hypothetical protein